MPLRECVAPGEMLDNPEKCVEYWRINIVKADWFDPAKEACVVLILNVRNGIIGHNLVTLGCIDTALVRPMEVFRPAIVAAGYAIVLMHNHPSGDPHPSEADIKVTRDLIRVGQLLKIDLLDSIVIGRKIHERDEDNLLPQEKGYLSLRELGYFY